MVLQIIGSILAGGVIGLIIFIAVEIKTAPVWDEETQRWVDEMEEDLEDHGGRSDSNA